MLINTEGIVLRQNKIANNRRIITLFTRSHGKINAGTNINERAKGRAALAIRPFTFAEYDIYKGQSYFNINNADVKKSYYSIGEDIDRYMVASKLLEYIDKTTEEEQIRPRLFDMTIEFMESITNAKRNYMTLFYAFVVKSLALNGVMPDIKQCVSCGKSLQDVKTENGGKVKYFSVSGGGILCEDCYTRLDVRDAALIFKPDFDIVEVLDYFAKRPLSSFEKVSLKPAVSAGLQRILSEYLKYYLDVDIFDDGLSL